MSCGVGRRRGLDFALLRPWCRLAATAPIQPLAWESPYVVGMALKEKKERKKKFLNVGKPKGLHNTVLNKSGTRNVGLDFSFIFLDTYILRV